MTLWLKTEIRNNYEGFLRFFSGKVQSFPASKKINDMTIRGKRSFFFFYKYISKTDLSRILKLKEDYCNKTFDEI